MGEGGWMRKIGGWGVGNWGSGGVRGGQKHGGSGLGAGAVSCGFRWVQVCKPGCQASVAKRFFFPSLVIFGEYFIFFFFPCNT